MSFLVYQRERCPNTGRAHVQGFCRFTSQIRFNQAKAKVQSAFRTTGSPRMCVSNGSVEQNIAYCSKVDSRIAGTYPVQLGSIPTHEATGKPSSTPLIIDCLNQGMTPHQALSDSSIEVAVKTYALRYARTWNYLLGSMIPDRDIATDPIVIVMYGLPRSGKTKLAHEMFPGSYLKPSGKWWDFYQGATSVIYDDFDGSSCCFGDWKRTVDRYPMLVEAKGGYLRLASTVHIITTNVYPSHWWSKKVTGQDGRDAIWGRITELWHFTSVNRPAEVYANPADFRALSENFSLESADPKGSPE